MDQQRVIVSWLGRELSIPEEGQNRFVGKQILFLIVYLSRNVLGWKTRHMR